MYNMNWIRGASKLERKVRLILMVENKRRTYCSTKRKRVPLLSYTACEGQREISFQRKDLRNGL